MSVKNFLCRTYIVENSDFPYECNTCLEQGNVIQEYKNTLRWKQTPKRTLLINNQTGQHSRCMRCQQINIHEGNKTRRKSILDEEQQLDLSQTRREYVLDKMCNYKTALHTNKIFKNEISRLNGIIAQQEKQQKAKDSKILKFGDRSKLDIHKNNSKPTKICIKHLYFFFCLLRPKLLTQKSLNQLIKKALCLIFFVCFPLVCRRLCH